MLFDHEEFELNLVSTHRNFDVFLKLWIYIKNSRFSINFCGKRCLGYDFIFLWLTHIYIQVTCLHHDGGLTPSAKYLDRKSVSHNKHLEPSSLQEMLKLLTGVDAEQAETSVEKVNKHKTKLNINQNRSCDWHTT